MNLTQSEILKYLSKRLNDYLRNTLYEVNGDLKTADASRVEEMAHLILKITQDYMEGR